MNVGRHAQAQGRVAVIEHSEVLLPVRNPQAPAKNLDEQDLAFGWPSQDETRDQREIDAGNHGLDRDDDLDLPLPQAFVDPRPLVRKRQAVLVLGRNASRLEFVSNAASMGPVDAERQRRVDLHRAVAKSKPRRQPTRASTWLPIADLRDNHRQLS